MPDEEQGLDLGFDGPGLKRVAVLLGLAFAITLAVVIGKRLSAEAMAVVVGIVCGVIASVPASLLLFVALSRAGRQPPAERSQPGDARNYPPVVVIQGGAPQALPPGLPAGYWPALDAGSHTTRTFHVVGGDDLLDIPVPSQETSWRGQMGP